MFSVPNRNANEVLGYVIHRLNEIASHGISAEQLEQERRRIVRWHEIATDNASGLASYLAYEAFRSNESTLQKPDSYRWAVAELTLEQVNQAAADLLSEHNRATFVGGRIGPVAWIRFKRRLRGK